MGNNVHHGHHHGDHISGAARSANADEEVKNPDKPFTDPVCGMKVAANPEKKRVYAGNDYYFCSASCIQKFDGNPEKFIKPSAFEPVQDMPSGTIYTCPMHPEIRQPTQGNCPICGLSLIHI